MNITVPNLPKLDECIPHRNWQRAFEEAFPLLITAQPGEVVCIVGPSRAGKTTLIQSLVPLLSGENAFEESGELPVVAVEASNTGPNGRFSTKSFVHQMLEAVRHPMYSGSERLLANEHTSLDRKPEHELRRALELALKHRQSRYLFIDEAQHAGYATRDSLAVMDSWKCLARAGGVVLVLVGAYPMLDIIRDSPHMVGRKREVHLPRYGSNREDIREFGRILQFYERKFGEEYCSNNILTEQLELLYSGSLGCIGLLRAWLRQAASMAHVQEVPIDREILLRFMLSDADRNVLMREITDGERLRQSTAPDYRTGNHLKPSAKTETKKQTVGGGKPFQRKPKRHQPGGRSARRAGDGSGGML